MIEIPVSDIDVFYLSFDEPRRDEMWLDLQHKAPWAKRVHGVKGFDNAHRECARQSNTSRLITVDGDNIVDADFFEKVLTIPEQYVNHTFSWAAVNAVNGLIYGNGGVKCWSREVLENINIHDASDDKKKVDFCWEDNYLQMKNCYSTTYPNGSPFQAFRAGFREGVKMTLHNGERVSAENITRVWSGNIKRLRVWCSIGADIENGLWCIYGTRLGTAMTMLDNWDITKIADYDWFKEFWTVEVAPQFAGDREYCHYTDYGWDPDRVRVAIDDLGRRLLTGIGLHTALFDADESRLYREIQVNPYRSHLVMETE